MRWVILPFFGQNSFQPLNFAGGISLRGKITKRQIALTGQKKSAPGNPARFQNVQTGY
ncbi:MAG: hypothetical protein JXR15_02485 [Shimia sp.]|uniref:hypothetical protein n=1 Tax=Shimia sp. TaxID=1954381 RepID=UPI003B8B946B